MYEIMRIYDGCSWVRVGVEAPTVGIRMRVDGGVWRSFRTKTRIVGHL